MLAHNRAVCSQKLAHDAIGFARIDVVRADEVEAAAVIVDQEAAKGEAVLVRGGAGVDDVRRGLEALVQGRIPEQAIEPLDDRQHGLAARRGVAAEDGGDLVLDHQALGIMAESHRFRPRIVDDRHELAPVDAAGGVDLLDRQQRALQLRVLDDRHEAGREKSRRPARARTSSGPSRPMDLSLSRRRVF